MKEDTCDKTIEILQATSDGDKLSLLDLNLVENAVNGFLSEEGIKVFNQLHEIIVAGKYKYPWFHGIENMTIDHVGYVFWKGATVEHYEQPWAYSKEAQENAQKLKRRCEILESKGIPLNITTVIWNWVEGE
jgi:hypothetical protein